MDNLARTLSRRDNILTERFALGLVAALIVGVLLTDLFGPLYLVTARFYTIPILIAGLLLSTRQTMITTVTALSLAVFVDVSQGRFSVDYLLLLGLLITVGAVATILAYTIASLRRSAAEAAAAWSRVSALLAVAEEVNSTLEVDEVLRRIVQRAAELTHSDLFGLVAISDSDGLHLRALYCEGEFRKITGLSRERELKTFADLVTSEGARVVGLRDPGNVPAAREFVGQLPLEGAAKCNYLMMHPVNSRTGSPIGIIAVGSHAHHYSGQDVELLAGMSRSVASALMNVAAFADSRSEAETLALLNEASRVLNSNLNLRDAVDTLTSLAKDFFVAEQAHVRLFGDVPEADALRPLESHPSDPSVAAAFLSGSELADTALFSRKIVSYSDLIEDHAFSVDVKEKVAESGIRGAAFVPLIAQEEVIGTLAVFWSRPHSLTQHECDIADILTGQAVTAIKNAQLYHDSKRANHRMSILFGLSRRISGRMNIDEIAREISSSSQQLLAPALVTVDMPRSKRRGHPEDDAPRKVIGEEGHRQICSEVAQRILELGDLAASNEDRSIVRAYNLPCSSQCRFPEMRKDQGYHSMVAVPIVHGEDLRGAITVLRMHDRRLDKPFADDDVALIRTLSSLAGVAVANATTFERHRAIALALQENLLPKEIPVVAGVDIGTFYASATIGAFIGGDFYDFVPISSDKLAVCIGDVCGKGIEAASDTAMTKYMLRLLISEDHRPGALLSRLNQALCSNLQSGRFVTLFYGVLDTSTWEFEYACAGHHSPVFVRHGYPAQLPIETGVALGIIPGSEYDDLRISVSQGDLVLLYTDGLVEAKREQQLMGVERLMEFLVEQSHSAAEEIATLLPRFALNYANGNLVDDLAIVALRFSGAPAAEAAEGDDRLRIPV